MLQQVAKFHTRFSGVERAERNLEGAENTELINELTTVDAVARAGKACTDPEQIAALSEDAKVSCRLACYLLNPRYVLRFDAATLSPCAGGL